jgi:large subunit ribosomal protein L13e
VSKKVARTIGIAVDHRRVNRSVASMEGNVERLKEYKSKLIVFPRRSNQRPKSGDSSAAETSAATQHTGVVMPLSTETKPVEFADVSASMKEEKAYDALRLARTDAKLVGVRLRMKKERDEAEKK